MSDHLFQGQTEATYLVPVFESLRRYDGLTAKRLATRAAQPLLRLPIVQNHAVQNHAVQTGGKPAEAALEVTTDQIQTLDSPTDRKIADAILKLGIYLEAYKEHNVSRRASPAVCGVDPRLLSEVLLSRGLRSLCLLGDPGGGTIYESGKPGPRSQSRATSSKNPPSPETLFCAALAARLIEDRTLTDTIRWAAAMASVADSYHDLAAHPRRAAVDEKYRQIMPQEVLRRPSQGILPASRHRDSDHQPHG